MKISISGCVWLRSIRTLSNIIYTVWGTHFWLLGAGVGDYYTDCFLSVPHMFEWKVQLPLYAAEPSRLIASPGLMLHSSLRSCSHFKRSLIPCYMYDSWWVCSKAFRFIIKWMKQYLCESKLIQMCAGVSCRLCLSPTWNLVGSGGNLLVLQKWKQAGCIWRALIYDSRFRLAVLQQYLATFEDARLALARQQTLQIHGNS